MTSEQLDENCVNYDAAAMLLHQIEKHSLLFVVYIGAPSCALCTYGGVVLLAACQGNLALDCTCHGM